MIIVSHLQSFGAKIGACGKCIRMSRNLTIIGFLLCGILYTLGPIFSSIELFIAISASLVLSAWYLLNITVFGIRAGIIQSKHSNVGPKDQIPILARRRAIFTGVRVAAGALAIGFGLAGVSHASCCVCVGRNSDGKCNCWHAPPGCGATCVCQ